MKGGFFLTEQKDYFLKGAFVLASAGLVVKVLGAVYRIPLARLIEDEGMGLYQMAYPIYLILLSISTAGIPTAISKMVSEDIAIGRFKNAYRIFKVSMIVLAIIGLSLTVLLGFGANWLAVRIYKNPKAFYSILSISPAIFFVSIMSCFRGFFQGLQDMTPSAVSQIVEQVGRVIAVFILAYMLLPYGVEYAAAGAAFGPVAGSIMGLIVLIAIYYRRKRSFDAQILLDESGSLENPLHIINRLFIFAVPITLGGLISPIMSMADAAIVSSRLQDAGFSVKRAAELFGQLSGMAVPLINLPVVITVALSATLVPAISEAVVLKNRQMVAERSETGMRMSIIFGLPSAVGMYVLATPITLLLYNNAEAGMSLQILAWGVVFLALTQTTTGILQGVGYAGVPVRNMVFGALIKIFINYFLTAMPSINIKGAAMGTVIGYLVPSILNCIMVIKLTNAVFDLKHMLLKPAFASGIMGITAYVSHTGLMALGLSQNKATLVAIVLGAAIYGLVLITVGGIKKSDLEFLPGNQRIIAFLNKFGLLRG